MFTALPLTSETSGLTVSSMIMGSLPGQDTSGSFPPTQVHRPATPVLPGWPTSRGSPSSFLTTVPLTEDFDDLINNPLDTLASELPSSLPDTPQFQPQWACPCQAPTPKSLLTTALPTHPPQPGCSWSMAHLPHLVLWGCCSNHCPQATSGDSCLSSPLTRWSGCHLRRP